jgi:hypothetical protein
MAVTEMGPVSGTNYELAALLFMTSVMMTLDAYSTLESSPWTAENFGADPIKAASCREYMRHAVAFSMIYAIASSIMARKPWPLIGALTANGYLIFLYERALNRGAVSGSVNWANA